MATLTLYYATNRKHVGTDRWHPTSYGSKFSDDGMENLRFGALSLQADEAKISKFVAKKMRVRKKKTKKHQLAKRIL